MKRCLFFYLFLIISFSSFAQFWQATNGPQGGNFWEITSNEGTGYTFLVTHWSRLKGNGLGSNIFSSNNGGNSWAEIDNGILGQPVYKLCHTPIAPYLVIAVMDTMVPLAAGTKTAIYFSDNNGMTWSQKNNTYFPGNTPPTSLIFNENADTIFSGQRSNGISYSSDKGVSWHTINTGISNLNITDLEYGYQDALFASTDSLSGNTGKIFKRLGGTWIDFSAGLAGSRIADLLYDKSNGIMYLGTSNIQSGTGNIYRSVNGGAWTIINGYSGMEVQKLLLTASGELLVRSLNQGIWKYSTGIWTSINANLNSLKVSGFSLTPSGDVLATTKAGIWKLNPAGDSWIYFTNSLRNTQGRALAFSKNGDILTGTDNGIYRSVNNGTTWTHVGLTDTTMMSLSLDPFTGNMYAGNSDNSGSKIFVSKNNGLTWSTSSSGLISTRTTDFTYNSEGKIFCGTGWSRPIHSSTDGVTWNGPLSASIGFSQPRVVIALAIDTNDNIFAGTEAIGVYKSSDKGISYNWSGFSGGDVTDIQISPNQTVFVAHNIANSTYGFLYRSKDAGNSWTPNLMVNKGYTNCIYTASDDSIYVGTTLGVWLSTDTGNTWSQINSGLNLGNLVIHTLELGKDGYLYAGTGGAGIYKSTSKIKGSSTGIETNTYRKDLQLFPNPNKGDFILTTEKPLKGEYRLNIINCIGQIISSNYLTSINSQNSINIHLSVAPGSYSLQLTNGDEIYSEKFIVIN